jgi:hypothetical protein
MGTPAAAQTTDLPATLSLLQKNGIVWVSMGSKAGTRGFDGEPFWATVVHLIPATNEVKVRRHDTKRTRNVPEGACKVQKAIADGVPNPNSRPSWSRLGQKDQKRLEEVAAAKVENELRRLHIEADKLRVANLKSTDAAANEMALALKHLGRKKGAPPPPPPFFLSLACASCIVRVHVHARVCAHTCTCVDTCVHACVTPPHFLSHM